MTGASELFAPRYESPDKVRRRIALDAALRIASLNSEQHLADAETIVKDAQIVDDFLKGDGNGG